MLLHAAESSLRAYSTGFYRNSGFAARISTGVGKLVSIWIACLGFLLQVCSMSVGLCLMRQLRTCVHSPPAAAAAAPEPTDDPTSCLGPKSEGVRRAWIGQTRIFSFGRMLMILLTFFLQFSPVTGVRVAASPIGAAEAAHVHFHQAAQGGAAKHYGYPLTVHGAANSRAGTRSFRRACARAQSSQQGGSWYRGRWLTAGDLRAVPLRRIPQASGHSRSRAAPRGSAAQAVSCGASGARLHVLRCGGLSTGLLDETSPVSTGASAAHQYYLLARNALAIPYSLRKKKDLRARCHWRMFPGGIATTCTSSATR